MKLVKERRNEGRKMLWQRMSFQTVIAGGLGLLGGTVIVYFSKLPVSPTVWKTMVNSGIAGLTIAGSQEIVREIRLSHRDDLLNSILGGFAVGAVVGGLGGGRQRALAIGIPCSFLGCLLQLSAIEARELRLRILARELILGETATLKPDIPPVNADIMKEENVARFKLPEWFPIKQFDEEEAKRRRLEKENAFRSSVEEIRDSKS